MKATRQSRQLIQQLRTVLLAAGGSTWEGFARGVLDEERKRAGRFGSVAGRLAPLHRESITFRQAIFLSCSAKHELI
jgi:hypothetical protein